MQNKTAHHLTIHHVSSTDICTVHDLRAVVFAKAKLLVTIYLLLVIRTYIYFPLLSYLPHHHKALNSLICVDVPITNYPLTLHLSRFI